MRSIEIDDDVYDHIAKNTKEIGEPASKILRRLLGLDQPFATNSENNFNELKAVFESPSLKFNSAVDQYLLILGFAYQEKPQNFSKILDIKGRGRKYFALSPNEILESGTNTHPKQIYGTPYWAMTNSSNDQKAALLRQALIVSGFKHETASAAAKLIG